MTLPELAQHLVKLGYPVAYSHFKSAQSLPFICYLVVEGDTFTADDTVFGESAYVDIELYSPTKNLAAEKKIKEMLKTNELPWDYNEVYIADEGFFKCTFSIKLIN